MMPKKMNAWPAATARKCEIATPKKGSRVIDPRTPNGNEEMAVVSRNSTAKRTMIAHSRATTKERLRSGRTPSVRQSRRSGKMFSQTASVTNAVAVIDSSSAIVRSHAIMARMISTGGGTTYFFMRNSGRMKDGAARKANTDISTCTCGMPCGINSLSNIREKNVRARIAVCCRSLITAASPRRCRARPG